LPLFAGRIFTLNSPFRSHAAGLFSGSFKGENLAYDAQGDQGGYTGHMKLDDATFKFNAREKNGDLQGTFESNGSTFDFSATLKAILEPDDGRDSLSH